jgi:large subunit ribosomal protein L23
MKPLATEKAVMMIESQNTLTFITEKQKSKTDIKKELEETLNIKINKIKTLIKGNRKYAYVKLNPSNLAIDVATKLGIM